MTFWPIQSERPRRVASAESLFATIPLRDRFSSYELYSRLRIDSMPSTVTRSRLRWYGHVQRKDDMDCVKRCTEYEVSGHVGRGRGRKAWKECVENDLNRLNLDPSMVTDRESWRRLVRLSV